MKQSVALLFSAALLAAACTPAAESSPPATSSPAAAACPDIKLGAARLVARAGGSMGVDAFDFGATGTPILVAGTLDDTLIIPSAAARDALIEQARTAAAAAGLTVDLPFEADPAIKPSYRITFAATQGAKIDYVLPIESQLLFDASYATCGSTASPVPGAAGEIYITPSGESHVLNLLATTCDRGPIQAGKEEEFIAPGSRTEVIGTSTGVTTLSSVNRWFGWPAGAVSTPTQEEYNSAHAVACQ